MRLNLNLSLYSLPSFRQPDVIPGYSDLVLFAQVDPITGVLTDTIGGVSVLKSSYPSNAHPTMQQVKSSVCRFDGTGAMTLKKLDGTAATVTLVGDFIITVPGVYALTTANQAILGNSADWGMVVGHTSALRPLVRIAGSSYEFSAMLLSASDKGMTITRIGNQLTCVSGEQSQTVTCVTANMVLNEIGRRGGSAEIFTGDLWDLECGDYTGGAYVKKLSLAMVCMGGGVELSSDNSIDANGVTGTGVSVIEVTDGTGSDLINNWGYSTRQNRIKWSELLSNSIWTKNSGLLVAVDGDGFKITFTTSSTLLQAIAGQGYTVDVWGLAPSLGAYRALNARPRRLSYKFVDSRLAEWWLIFTAYQDGNAVSNRTQFACNERSNGDLQVGVQQNSGYWFADNFQLFKGPLNVPDLGTVVCLGDSLTINWPNQFALLYPTSTIVNSAVGGDTIRQMINRFPTDVAAHNPDKIIIMASSNDQAQDRTFEQIKSDYLELIELCEATTANEIILNETLPRADHINYTTAQGVVQQQVHTWLKTLGYKVVLQYEHMGEPTKPDALCYAYTTDDVHPSEAVSWAYLADEIAEQAFGFDFNYVATQAYPITGRQPANYQSFTDNQGPLRRDLIVTSGDTYPDVTVKAPLGAMFQGISEWTGEAERYLPYLPSNHDNRQFVADNGIAIYSESQTDTIAQKVLKYLHEPFWPDGLVLANDVFNPANNRGAELLTSYAGNQYLDGVSIGANPAVSSKGLDIGPAYTNLVPAGGDDFSGSVWTKGSNVVVGSQQEITGVSGLWNEYSLLNASDRALSIPYTPTIGKAIKFTFNIYSTQVTTLICVCGTGSAESFGIAIGLNEIEYSYIPTTTDVTTLYFYDPSGGTGSRFYISKPMFVESPYLHDYIPPGATKASSAATSAGNGASIEMDAPRPEVPDGVEKISTWVSGSGGSIVVSGSQVSISTVGADTYANANQPLSVILGERYRLKLTCIVPGGNNFGLSSTPTSAIDRLIIGMTAGEYDVVYTATATETVYLQLPVSGLLATAVYADISVQKLIPDTSWVNPGQAVLGALRGVPDGVEVAPTLDFTGWTINGEPDSSQVAGVITLVNTSPSIHTVAYKASTFTTGERYAIDFTVDSITSGNLAFRSSGGGVSSIGVTTPGKHSVIVSAIGTTIEMVGGGGTNAVLTELSVQKLQPAECTILAENYMGVGSADLPENFQLNVVSVRNNNADLLYANDYLGNGRIVRSSDGVNLPIIAAEWNPDEVHKRVVQSNGTQFRVGYRSYESDGITPISAWVWSSYSAFDGSFDPLDFLRFGYLNTVPLWHRNLYMWQRGDVTEAELNNPLEVTV